MMFSIYKLKRLFNQNIRNIIIAIIVIAFVIGGIQLLNYIAKENNKKNVNTVITEYEENKGEAYSVITDTEINKKTNNENIDLIDEFIGYCKSGDTENAYNLLTDECKEVYYPTINDFIENYYNRVFNGEKTHSVQAWITSNGKHTYKVKILEDMMATGKYTSEGSIEDYYTVINNEKININKFIGREEINLQTEKENVKFTIKYKDIYIDYEQYCIDVNNYNDFSIAIDSKETTKAIYLTGKNNTKYSSYIHELTIEDLIIDSNKTKEISIKFNKIYNPDIETKNITISDMIWEYNNYLKNKEDIYKKSITVEF